MENGNGGQTQSLHSLIPLEDFKALLGIDDREDKTVTFCLITATYSIEEYCGRITARFYPATAAFTFAIIIYTAAFNGFICFSTFSILRFARVVSICS
ncbi:hypothetical protein AGMMS50293_15270 [Spirochaetia bacterium]|nr:hypothetical protein AGMMS50293_15270 [Spirochaetia bacterium]